VSFNIASLMLTWWPLPIEAVRSSGRLLPFALRLRGRSRHRLAWCTKNKKVSFSAAGGANLVAYVGQDGLMDFRLPSYSRKQNEIHRDAIIWHAQAGNTLRNF
jgi:hypothetical protein